MQKALPEQQSGFEAIFSKEQGGSLCLQQKSSQGSGCTRAHAYSPSQSRKLSDREQGSPKDRNVLLGTGLILLFKIQNPDLNNWGTNCHKKCQPMWTAKISTRLTCYMSSTTGCILGFPERGGSEEANEWHSSLPGSLLLAGGRPSKSKEPSFPESALLDGGRSSNSRGPFWASFPARHQGRVRNQYRHSWGELF